MPTLYWKHEATTQPVVSSTIEGTFFIVQPAIMEACYICIVDRGKCWAGRSFNVYGKATRTQIKCADISNDETGKQILLKHFLLGL